jgi:hypothetical protein
VFLVAEEAAVFEDAAVGANGCGDGLAGVAGGVFEGDVVGFETGAVDLNGFGEEGAAGVLCVEGVGDNDVFGRFAFAEESDVGVILGDDDAFMIGAGGDLDVHAAAWTGPGMVVQGILDGGEDGLVFVARVSVRRGGIDADVDVLCAGEGNSESEQNENEEAKHWDKGRWGTSLGQAGG